MPAKKAVSKNIKPKSNIAKSVVTAKKKPVNKLFLVVLFAVFAAAMGYLFLRLSHAGINGAQWLPDQFENNGGSVTTKADGRRAWVGKAGQTAAINDPEWIAARGDQNWCVGARLESDGEAEVNLDVIPNIGFPGDNPGSKGAWLLREKGKELLLCPNTSNNVGYAQNIMRRQLDVGAVNRYARVSIKGGGTVAIFSIGRSLVPGTYVELPKPPTNSPTAPSQNQETTVAPADQPRVCPTYTLAVGSSGDCVKYAQGLLNAALGLTGTGNQLGVDGQYGTKTRDAVKMFQASIGKTGNANDGIIGAGTWPRLIETANNKLSAIPNPPTPAPTPCTPGQKGCPQTTTPYHNNENNRTLLLFSYPNNRGVDVGNSTYYNTSSAGDSGAIAVPTNSSGVALLRFCATSDQSGKTASRDHSWDVKVTTTGLNPASFSVPISVKAGQNLVCTNKEIKVTSTTPFTSYSLDKKVTFVKVDSQSLRSTDDSTTWLDWFWVQAQIR